MAGHNDLIQLMDSPFRIPDPGSGNAIATPRQLVTLVNFNTGAGAETGTIADPSIACQVLIIRLETDGGGTRTYTSDSAVNVSGHTSLPFGDADDVVVLFSVPNGSAFRWEVLLATGVTPA